MSRILDICLSPPVMIATFPESLPDMVPCVNSDFVRLPGCNDETSNERSEPYSVVFADCLLTFPSSTNIPRWLPCVHAGCCTPKLSELSGIPRASAWAGDVGGSHGVELGLGARVVLGEFLIVFVTQAAQKRLKAVGGAKTFESTQKVHGQQSTVHPSSLGM